MDKIIFRPEQGEPVEFFVLEQTTLGGADYILVTDCEDGDSDALILKDLSKRDEEQAVYEVVSDDTELNAVAAIFENLLEHIEFTE